MGSPGKKGKRNSCVQTEELGKEREVDLLLNTQRLEPTAEWCRQSWGVWIFKGTLKIATENELCRLHNKRAVELSSACCKTESWHVGNFEERKTGKYIAL